MTLPFFYNEEAGTGNAQFILNEETSRHIVQVLRMKKDENVNVTNGKGYLFLTRILDDNKKKVTVFVMDTLYQDPSPKKISIAISPVKNATRFEWFLEKATEIGVQVIIPVICKRTEKQHFRMDRMKNILISAMLQSQQTWLPDLKAPLRFDELIRSYQGQQKFIAHCLEEDKASLTSFHPFNHPLILIGPEGDFTQEEITSAIGNGFKAVTLGNTRLRTETAGIVAVTMLNS